MEIQRNKRRFSVLTIILLQFGLMKTVLKTIISWNMQSDMENVEMKYNNLIEYEIDKKKLIFRYFII